MSEESDFRESPKFILGNKIQNGSVGTAKICVDIRTTQTDDGIKLIQLTLALSGTLYEKDS